MPETRAFTLGKEERICSRRLIESLFKGGDSRALSAFPLRVVYRLEPRKETGKAVAQMMVSVSKRHFKKAIKRNRVKRQIRETYRKHKYEVIEKVPEDSLLLMAFIWIGNKLYDTKVVEERITGLLTRISERL